MNAVRMAQGRAAEQQVRAALESCGFIVEGFGQDLLSDQLRDQLRRHGKARPLVRWLVDLVVWRPSDGLTYAIDVKDTGRAAQTGNYSIEQSSCDSMAIAAALFDPIRCLYVWPDGACATPDIVRAEAAGPFDGRGSNGSGTPYYLLACDKAQPWPWAGGES